MGDANMSKELECMKEDENVYKIGVFSKMNQVTIKQLRYYDEIGLLKLYPSQRTL